MRVNIGVNSTLIIAHYIEIDQYSIIKNVISSTLYHLKYTLKEYKLFNVV